ncbi:MAG TPA: SMI1/KNR4 family protein, partial [Polyangium sp.]|nr:SMI1/KNR4 family protein [Polyangium sp.]
VVMNFFDEGAPLTAEDIDALETTVGKPFPPEYRAFLLAHNGGRPESAIVDIDDCPAGASVVQMFLGVTGPVESETLEWSWKVFQGRIPERLLPVADDPFGNLFCLSLDDQDRGCVFFLDRYEESPAQPHLAARSWNDFLAKLRPYTPEERAIIEAASATSSTPDTSDD